MDKGPKCGSNDYGPGPMFDSLRWIGCHKCGYGFKDKPDFGKGTKVRMASGVPVCSMAIDYRDCLDLAMEEWKKHKRELPKTLGGKRYRPGVYAFAYWLIRWSGLVVPARGKERNHD